MKKPVVILALIVTGCASSSVENDLLDLQPLPPEPLIKKDLVEKSPDTSPEELKKGPSTPGRVINYRGHGLGYGSHAQYHYHIRDVHGPACPCCFGRR